MTEQSKLPDWKDVKKQMDAEYEKWIQDRVDRGEKLDFVDAHRFEAMEKKKVENGKQS